MISKKTKVLYVEFGGAPLRIELTPEKIDRVHKLQTMLKNLPLKRNEVGTIEVYSRKGIVKVRKDCVDIGDYGYEGWDSFLPEMNLKTIDQIPDVYFGMMYLYYMKEERKNGLEGKFRKLILPCHEALVVWKQIVGEA